jgi:hypothetical protein
MKCLRYVITNSIYMMNADTRWLCVCFRQKNLVWIVFYYIVCLSIPNSGPNIPFTELFRYIRLKIKILVLNTFHNFNDIPYKIEYSIGYCQYNPKDAQYYEIVIGNEMFKVHHNKFNIHNERWYKVALCALSTKHFSMNCFWFHLLPTGQLLLSNYFPIIWVINFVLIWYRPGASVIKRFLCHWFFEKISLSVCPWKAFLAWSNICG